MTQVGTELPNSPAVPAGIGGPASWIAEAAVYDIRGQVGYVASDVTAAVNAAAAAIAASNAPGAILIPSYCNFSGVIDLTGCVQGVAFVSSQRAASISSCSSALVFVGTSNPAAAIKAQGLNSFGCIGVGLLWTDVNFTGQMIGLDGTQTVNGKFVHFSHSLVRGVGTADSAIGISLNQTYGVDFDHCVLYGTNVVRGKATNADFANRVNFGPGCYIRGKAGAPIRNPDMAWTFTGVTFEPPSTAPGAAAIVTHDAGVLHRGMSFRGCYMADDSSTTAGAWIVAASNGQPIEISGGNILSALAAGTSIVKVDANGHGPITIIGNTTFMAGGAYFVDYGATTGHGACYIDGNGFSSVPTAAVNGTIPGGSSVRLGVTTSRSDYVDTAGARLHYGDVATRYVDTYRVVGDTGDRLRIRADGTIAFGDGAGNYHGTISYVASGQIGIAGTGVVQPVTVQTGATYPATVFDRTIVGNNATGITVTLPAVASETTGKEYILKNKGAGSMTVNVSGGATIDGGTSIVLTQYQTARVIDDGTQWLTF